MATDIQLLEDATDSPLLGAGTQRALAKWNRQRLEPRLPDEDAPVTENRDRRMLQTEGAFLSLLRQQVRAAAALAPTDAKAFVQWFAALEANGPGQEDPLFPWLADQATRDQMRWYLQQEAAGEAGF